MCRKNIKLITVIILLLQLIQIIFISDVYGEELDTHNDLYYIAYSRNAKGGIYSQILIIKEDDYNGYLKGEDLYGLELMNFNHYRDISMLEEEYLVLQEEIDSSNILFNINSEYKEGRKLIYSEDDFRQEFRIEEPVTESRLKESILNQIDFVLRRDEIRKESTIYILCTMLVLPVSVAITTWYIAGIIAKKN